MREVAKMSWRARLYLFIAIGVYGMFIGLALLSSPERFTAPAWSVLRNYMPYGMIGWGWAHILVGALGIYASVRGRETPARVALIAISILLAPWVHGLAFAVVHQPQTSPVGVVGYGTLMCVHLIMLRYPLRTPFQDLLKAVRDEEK